ncbi:hypothetical protein [Amycolatopsis sp. NPDC051102]|uniref:hypothetical protein n=1 Tax=Amycolatopsis sp. NPDC051102 TaxID=3155163 RepID=UPI003431B41C
MKRMVFFAVSALAAFVLAAPSAAAQPARVGPFCIPESLWLDGVNGTAICLAVATPSITPPFTAVSEQNGSQNDWCLFTQPGYAGLQLRVPAFSQTHVWVTIASARPC